jgi:hypothetical protein
MKHRIAKITRTTKRKMKKNVKRSFKGRKQIRKLKGAGWNAFASAFTQGPKHFFERLGNEVINHESVGRAQYLPAAAEVTQYTQYIDPTGASALINKANTVNKVATSIQNGTLQRQATSAVNMADKLLQGGFLDERTQRILGSAGQRSQNNVGIGTALSGLIRNETLEATGYGQKQRDAQSALDPNFKHKKQGDTLLQSLGITPKVNQDHLDPAKNPHLAYNTPAEEKERLRVEKELSDKLFEMQAQDAARMKKMSHPDFRINEEIQHRQMTRQAERESALRQQKFYREEAEKNAKQGNQTGANDLNRFLINSIDNEIQADRYHQLLMDDLQNSRVDKIGAGARRTKTRKTYNKNLLTIPKTFRYLYSKMLENMKSKRGKRYNTALITRTRGSGKIESKSMRLRRERLEREQLQREQKV